MTVKHEPRPSAERTSTRCPSTSAACFTMKSPRPRLSGRGTRTLHMTGRLRATRCRLQEDREMETIGFLDPVRSALVTSRDTRRTIRVKRADDALNSGIFSRMGASFSARSAGYLGVIFDVA